MTSTGHVVESELSFPPLVRRSLRDIFLYSEYDLVSFIFHRVQEGGNISAARAIKIIPRYQRSRRYERTKKKTCRHNPADFKGRIYFDLPLHSSLDSCSTSFTLLHCHTGVTLISPRTESKEKHPYKEIREQKTRTKELPFPRVCLFTTTLFYPFLVIYELVNLLYLSFSLTNDSTIFLPPRRLINL